MQALRTASARLLPGVRRMGSAAADTNADAMWAKFFPKPAQTPEAVKKSVNKELLGFMLLGPVGAAFMFYDFVVGLEEEHDVVIPP